MLDYWSRGCVFESHPRQNLNFCHVLFLRVLLSPFRKISTSFRWPGSSTEMGLKIRFYKLRWLAVVSDCTGARVENDTRPARHKQYTHGYCTCPPHHTTFLWLHGLCTPCRVCCEKQHKSPMITWARIRQVLTRREVEWLPTSLPDCHP